MCIRDSTNAAAEKCLSVFTEQKFIELFSDLFDDDTKIEAVCKRAHLQFISNLRENLQEEFEKVRTEHVINDKLKTLEDFIDWSKNSELRNISADTPLNSIGKTLRETKEIQLKDLEAMLEEYQKQNVELTKTLNHKRKRGEELHQSISQKNHIVENVVKNSEWSESSCKKWKRRKVSEKVNTPTSKLQKKRSKG
eukprot:TRINITY_DN7342_c0_g1_i1.p1 TRINITY_DN7342_c0_g1~~TRINITY_DN7342_c0_g1_i1.p1  ORF type:complete len:195 (-),score=42.33 TRINITY_DN7342_c0_g1_i1:15-599(-)